MASFTEDGGGPLDTQTIELLGRQRLAGELLAAGLEVAEPMRDRGVDLIAYAELDRQLNGFTAKPIQMKAARERSFGIWNKYQKIHDLIIAFVWHLESPSEAATYALTCQEAEAIATRLGWTGTASWTEKGLYTTTNPSAELCEELKQYRMTPEGWWRKVTGLPLV